MVEVREEERVVSIRDEDEEEDDVSRVMRMARVVRPLEHYHQVGNVHLVIGDSIARDFPYRVVEPDRIVNVAEGGLTYRRLVKQIECDLAYWRQQITSYEVEGTVVVWLGDNDVYPRRNEGAPGHLATRAVRDVISVLLETVPPHSIVILGPTPRQVDRRWEQSPAYHAETKIASVASDISGAITVVRYIGRPLADRNHGMTRRGVFKQDVVHLTPLAYERVAVRLPNWLK